MTTTLKRKRGVLESAAKKNEIEIAGPAFDWPQDGLRLRHDDPRPPKQSQSMGCLWLGASKGALGVTVELCGGEWEGTMGPVSASREAE